MLLHISSEVSTRICVHYLDSKLMCLDILVYSVSVHVYFHGVGPRQLLKH